MSWTIVAKKEFEDAIRSWWLIGLTIVFVVFAAGLTFAFQLFPPDVFGGPNNSNAATVALLSAIGGPAGFFVPLIGLAMGYKSVVGEREGGSLKLLLGLPHTRRDVVLGKLVGRSVVVAVSTVVGFAVAAVVAVAFYDSFAAVPFLVYTVLTIVLGVTFIAIGVGFSAAMRSTTWALLGAGLLYVLFQFVWSFIPFVIRVLDSGFSATITATQPDWAAFFSLLNPQTAFGYATRASIPALAGPASGGQPFYLQDWFGFVVLAVWIVVPVVLGYLRFDSTDL